MAYDIHCSITKTDSTRFVFSTPSSNVIINTPTTINVSSHIVQSIFTVLQSGNINITMSRSIGHNNHAILDNLDYSNSGHTNFQKKLNYVSEYKAYEIE